MRNETLLTPKELFSHGTTQAEQWARWREVESGSPTPARRAGPGKGQAALRPKNLMEEPAGDVPEAAFQAPGRWEGGAIQVNALPQTTKPSNSEDGVQTIEAS